MIDPKKDIHDDEFRVLGKPSPQDPHGKPKNRTVRTILLLAGLALLIGLAVIAIFRNRETPKAEEGLFEEIPYTPPVPEKPTIKPYGIETDRSFTEKRDTIINDVRLNLFIPHNARPELVLGKPDHRDTTIILSAQAADIRRDNRKILGAFVLKGKPLAWGLSKKGFCAIINDEITVGVSENSPLFEEATEKDGYFFRQYPLVDNGVLVENEPKNKAIRKALCSRIGEIFVAVSETEESLHDFAQALVDLGVENAIYLVGSTSYGWYVDAQGEQTLFAPPEYRERYKNENYIIWRR